MNRRKLLWVSDACVASGFARATHHILDVLQHTFDVTVLGLNYMGDPHSFPYQIFPAYAGGDALGMGRIGPICEALQPDVVVLQTDTWHVPNYIGAIREQGCLNTKIVGAIALDGKNCRGVMLNGLAHAIFWTEFARNEATIGGYDGPSAVVPLGVDLDMYHWFDKKEARKYFGFGSERGPSLDSFVVGCVNRNQQRKRFDLMAEYFCEWVKDGKIDDAHLLLHACPTGDEEFDVGQLMHYYGIKNRLMYVRPNIGQGHPEKLLAATYSCMDVYLSTSQGEGFGLPAIEAMACGVPCILGDWAAFGDWAREAAMLIPCPTHMVNFGCTNVIGGIMDKAQTINALDDLYRSKALQEEYRLKGFATASHDRYRWANIGREFRNVLDVVVPSLDEQAWQDLGGAQPSEALEAVNV